jgi:hypothetical protein
MLHETEAPTEVRRRPRAEPRTRPSTPSRRPEFRETSTLVWASRDRHAHAGPTWFRDAAVCGVPSPSACCQTDCPASPLTPRRRQPGCGFQMAGESAGPNGSGRWSWRGSHAGPADRLMPEARRLRASRNAEPSRGDYPVEEPQTTFAGSLSRSSSRYRQARDHQNPTASRRKYGGASVVSSRQPRCARRCL